MSKDRRRASIATTVPVIVASILGASILTATAASAATNPLPTWGATQRPIGGDIIGDTSIAVDPTRGLAFVGDGLGTNDREAVNVFSEASESSVANIATGAVSESLAVDPPAAQIFAADAGGSGSVDDVYAISETSLAVTNTIQLKGSPTITPQLPGGDTSVEVSASDVVADPTANLVYVVGSVEADSASSATEEAEGAVWEINPQTDTVVDSFSLGISKIPSNVAIDPTSGELFVVTPATDALLVVQNGVVAMTIPVGGSWPMGIAVDASTGSILVAEETSPNTGPQTVGLVKVSESSDAVVGTVALPGTSVVGVSDHGDSLGVDVDPSTGAVLADGDVVDESSLTVVQQLAPGGGIVAIDPTSEQLFMASPNPDGDFLQFATPSIPAPNLPEAPWAALLAVSALAVLLIGTVARTRRARSST